LADIVKFVVDLYSEDDSRLEKDIHMMLVKAEQGQYKLNNVVALSSTPTYNFIFKMKLM